MRQVKGSERNLARALAALLLPLAVPAPRHSFKIKTLTQHHTPVMIFSRASVAALAVLAATPLGALASSSFSTGSINKTRDYQVKWSSEWRECAPAFAGVRSRSGS